RVTNSQWIVDIEVGQSYEFQNLQTFAQSTGQVGFAVATQPWQLGVGIYRWAFLDPRYKIMKAMYNPFDGPIEESYIENDDTIFVNGILNTEQYALENANKATRNKIHATKVAYNPTDGPLADVVEAFLQKLTFTSAFDRQLADDLAGHKNITLIGHSQGGIIIGNTLLNLGLRGERDVVQSAIFRNTQISSSRAYLSSAIAGVNANFVTYGSSYFDPSNVGGPNLLDPLKFLSGIPGLYLPFGAQHHGIE
ncbi:MAG: hypothetical protein ABIJ41_00795, partial [Candidatus Omnitrophota bacterium]